MLLVICFRRQRVFAQAPGDSMQGDLQGWLMRLKAVTSTVQWSVNKAVTIETG